MNDSTEHFAPSADFIRCGWNICIDAQLFVIRFLISVQFVAKITAGCMTASNEKLSEVGAWGVGLQGIQLDILYFDRWSMSRDQPQCWSLLLNVQQIIMEISVSNSLHKYALYSHTSTQWLSWSITVFDIFNGKPQQHGIIQMKHSNTTGPKNKKQGKGHYRTGSPCSFKILTLHADVPIWVFT